MSVRITQDAASTLTGMTYIDALSRLLIMTVSNLILQKLKLFLQTALHIVFNLLALFFSSLTPHLLLRVNASAVITISNVRRSPTIRETSGRWQRDRSELRWRNDSRSTSTDEWLQRGPFFARDDECVGVNGSQSGDVV